MGKKKKKKEHETVVEKLDKSPINYFSDLFVVAMVIAWIVAIVIICIAAIYAMINMYDTSLWITFKELVEVPLTVGGGIWMIKNSVQHAIAANNGKPLEADFPAVNAPGEDEGTEQGYTTNEEEMG